MSSQVDFVGFAPLAFGYVAAPLGTGLTLPTPFVRGPVTLTSQGTGVVSILGLPAGLQAGLWGIVICPHNQTAQGIKYDVSVNGGTAQISFYRGDTGAAIFVPFSFVVFGIPFTT